MLQPALPQGSSAHDIDERLWADLNRALNNFRFFCKRFLRIKWKEEASGIHRYTEPLIPFVWNEVQERLAAAIADCLRRGENIWFVIIKARQLGVSTFFCAWIFWHMWRRSHVYCLIAAHKKSTLGVMLETINTYYESLPEGMRPSLRDKIIGARIPKHEVYLGDRHSMAMITPAKGDSGRGPSFDHAFCTEVASYPDPDEFFNSFEPSLGQGRFSSEVLESSPEESWLWNKYKAAKAGEGGWKAFFFEWFTLPTLYSLPQRDGPWRFPRDIRLRQRRLSQIATRKGYPPVSDAQMAWWVREWMKKGGDDAAEEWMRQEYPDDDVTCFERSSHSMFRAVLPIVRESVEAVDEDCPQAALGRLVTDKAALMDPSAAHDVTFCEDPKVDLERRPGAVMFKPVDPDHIYTLGADVADEEEYDDDGDEDESAFSTIEIYDCMTREEVFLWRGRLDPEDFAEQIAAAGYYYNTAMINVEMNQMGISTCFQLKKRLSYPYCFKWPDFDRPEKYTKKEFWVTNKATKKLMISSLRHAIRERLYIVRSEWLRDELQGYRILHGKLSAGTESYADCLIAAALAWQAVEQTGDLSTMVVRSLRETGKTGAGAAAHAIARAGNKKGLAAVPPELPAELGAAVAPTKILDIWSAATLDEPNFTFEQNLETMGKEFLESLPTSTAAGSDTT